MNDLISRSALIDFLKRLARFLKCEEFHKPKTKLIGDIIKYLEKQPAVDAVEVVRCRDCKYYESHGYKICKLHSDLPDSYSGGVNIYMEKDDFCSYGERRNGDG